MGSLWYLRHTICVSQGLTLSTASLVRPPPHQPQFQESTGCWGLGLGNTVKLYSPICLHRLSKNFVFQKRRLVKKQIDIGKTVISNHGSILETSRNLNAQAVRLDVKTSGGSEEWPLEPWLARQEPQKGWRGAGQGPGQQHREGYQELGEPLRAQEADPRQREGR